ncbi:hypothetical protein C8J57DRAFT_1239651 [Mycena rebaudengoi]|nr:hypothetical protein C8J57DRAFT_1239651 [Mycena rebaudengoi]
MLATKTETVLSLLREQPLAARNAAIYNHRLDETIPIAIAVITLADSREHTWEMLSKVIQTGNIGMDHWKAEYEAAQTECERLQSVVEEERKSNYQESELLRLQRKALDEERALFEVERAAAREATSLERSGMVASLKRTIDTLQGTVSEIVGAGAGASGDSSSNFTRAAAEDGPRANKRAKGIPAADHLNNQDGTERPASSILATSRTRSVQGRVAKSIYEINPMLTVAVLRYGVDYYCQLQAATTWFTVQSFKACAPKQSAHRISQRRGVCCTRRKLKLTMLGSGYRASKHWLFHK